MIYCVDCDVTREQYEEWQAVHLRRCWSLALTPLNLAVIRPGRMSANTSAETFKHLREIKAMLNDAIPGTKRSAKNDETK